MAIWLPKLAIERWRLSDGRTSEEKSRRREVYAKPLVLVSETAHGHRIEAANEAAFAAGSRVGMRLADARTVHPGLLAEPHDGEGDLVFLEKLALWARRWGPWSALDPPDGLLVDVTAVAHLFDGEERLLSDVERKFARRGLTARLAIAPTAGAAWALAHHGREKAILTLPHGEEIPASIARLPVAALRLDGEVLQLLKRLGLKRIGDLTMIGRDALQRRFRRRNPRLGEFNPLTRLDQLLGRMAEPLLPVIETLAPLVQRRLIEPLRHRDPLDQVLRDLAGDMVNELERRGEGARRLELGLWRVDGEVLVRRLELAAATRDAAHICQLFGAKLDDIDAGFGIELIRLRASWSEPLALEQEELEKELQRPGTSLATCIDRLSVRLGEKAVRRPVLRASHIPERAQRWMPPMEPEPMSQEQLAFHQRPLKLLDRPEPIAVSGVNGEGFPRSFRWRGADHTVTRAEGPERIAPEWWRERGHARLRDYYRIEDTEGRRFWIYRLGLAGDGRGGKPDWYLQGMYG